ncbi:MAG TPA: PH domain-containing protein [Pyrinomonadaceae bacterium]|nr:PH domain-containing protein [Pyrinomonadaceae bacterium]
MIYRSKKDWWLVGLVWGGVLAPFAFGLFNLFAPGGNLQLGWALVRVGVVASAAVLITTFPLNYEITETHLVARSGVMRWRVPLDSIEEVRPSRNPASAPTWSLDRLRVEYLKNGRARALYISPEDKRAFMRDLADGVPGLEMRGDRVVRVA